VDNGKTGYIVPPHDPTALAGAIVNLLKDPDACQRMGEGGYTKLKTDMAWSGIVKSLLAVYGELAPTPEYGSSVVNKKFSRTEPTVDEEP